MHSSNYPFSRIVIIFNPKSTGDSASNAKQLAKKLTAKLPNTVVIELLPTKYAGHAEEIAEKYAKKYKKPLIISASGDGGYNEVVNGAIKSGSKTVVTVVLPSGNANDHDAATSDDSMLSRILTPKIHALDALCIQATKDSKQWSRYAHSYIGVGLTAYIGKKLTEADLNPINEKWLAMKYLLQFQHVTLRLQGMARAKHYSSVVFGTIDRMSKVIKLGEETKPDDGKMEVYVTREHSFLKTLLVLLVASTVGMKQYYRGRSFNFNSIRELEVQCDGEVTVVGAGNVKVSLEKGIIQTLK